MGAAEEGRAAGAARFEVAAVEEQERSAEEQESERRDIPVPYLSVLKYSKESSMFRGLRLLA
jgi:hypothetical protein